MKLKLLIVQSGDEDTYERNIIDLELVKKCSIKKNTKSFYKASSRTKKTEHYLNKIVLHFEFTDNRESRELNFYRHINNNI